MEGVSAPVVVRLDDGTDLVGLRAFVKARAARTWPHQRNGRGRPSGGGMRRLAEAIGISRSRLSHLIASAEKSGRLSRDDFERIAAAFGHDSAEDLYEEYVEFWAENGPKEG